MRDFAHLTNLRVINASGNKLRDLPDNLFANCNKLTVVNFSGNELRSIPQSIVDLPLLDKLNVSDNQVNYRLEFPICFY